MKSLFIGLLALTSSLSTQASMLEVNGPLDATLFEAQVTEENTYFETLGDLFSKGTLPNLAKISNIAWSGRCFGKAAPNEPGNAGYVFRQKKNDAGPIANISKVYEAKTYWNLNQDPNYYDDMDLTQVLAKATDPFIEVKIKNDSIEMNLSASSKSNLKASGNYLIEEISGGSEDAGPVAKVTTNVRCYYFIPDLNN